MRSIGMDVHRSFAQIAIVEDGLCRDEGRIGVRPEDLRAWAATLGTRRRGRAGGDDELGCDRHDAAPAGGAGWWCRTRARPGRSPRRR